MKEAEIQIAQLDKNNRTALFIAKIYLEADPTLTMQGYIELLENQERRSK